MNRNDGITMNTKKQAGDGNIASLASGVDMALSNARKAAIDSALMASDIAGTAVSFAVDSLIPAMEAIAALADFEGMDDPAMRIRMALIQKLAGVAVGLACDMDGVMSGYSNNAKERLDALQGSAA